LYDSIGYYTYDELEPKDVWSYSLKLLLHLQQLISLDDSRLKNRIKDVVVKIQKHFDNVPEQKRFVVVPKWPEGFVEKDQMVRDIKKLTWRLGCCLAISLRVDESKKNKFIKFVIEFLEFLNKGIYNTQGISMIEDNFSHFEERFEKEFNTLCTFEDSLEYIKKEYNLTVNELKKLFNPQL